MANRVGRRLLRAQLGGSKLYRLFNIIFAVITFLIVVLAIIWNSAGHINNDFLWLLFAGFLGCVAGVLAQNISSRAAKPGKKAFVITVCALFALIIGAQIYVVFSFLPELEAGMQNSIVYKSATAYAMNTQVVTSHFLLNTADAGFYTLLRFIFAFVKLFGVSQFAITMVVLNILAANSAILMLVFVANRLFGRQKALHSLIICLITVPILLYVPFCTAELICLPLPVAMVLLWLNVRKNWRANEIKRAMVSFGALALLAAVGTILKTSILVVFIAAAVDLVVVLRGRGRALAALLGVVFTVVCVVGLGFLLRYTGAVSGQQTGDTMPVTAGILMGLKNTGRFDANLQQKLEDMPTGERSNYIASEINSEIAHKGVPGFIQHIGNKLSYTFSDGSYGAKFYIEGETGRNTLIQNLFAPNGGLYVPISYIIYAVFVATLFFVGLGAVKAFYRKNTALTFIRIAIFGVVLYQMIWVSEARYLVTYLPLLILASLEAGPPTVASRDAGISSAVLQNKNEDGNFNILLG